ncbi:MAG TPA: hypothetical protein VKY56_05690 [Chloroflexota bacterium]|nr:hypothetical protein [Chloroflexota bacterium]
MSEHLLYLGTNDGVVTVRRIPGGWQEVAAGLAGCSVQALAHLPGEPRMIFAGSDGRGLFFSSDAGQSWEPRNRGLLLNRIRSVLADPANPSHLFVGTEPAAIFRSLDRGMTWEELASFREVAGHEQWFIPYAPRAGAVCALAAVPGIPGRLYAGIEPGGVVVTDDGGRSWRLLAGLPDLDVHQILADVDDRLVLAATGSGVYRSFDGGESWEHVLVGYTRAIALVPRRPGCIVAGPAEQVGHRGWIARSDDGGTTWYRWSDGLPTPLEGIVAQVAARPGSLNALGGVFAVLSNGVIVHRDPDQSSWALLTCGPSAITVIDLT